MRYERMLERGDLGTNQMARAVTVDVEAVNSIGACRLDRVCTGTGVTALRICNKKGLMCKKCVCLENFRLCMYELLARNIDLGVL